MKQLCTNSCLHFKKLDGLSRCELTGELTELHCHDKDGPYMLKDDEGIKHDNGKPRWDLLPLDLIEETVKVLTFGAVKYGDNNWQKVKKGHERYYSALMRHITDYRKGELIDPETTYSHLAHAVCNLIFLDYLERAGGEDGQHA